MGKCIEVKGRYRQQNSRHVSSTWSQICAEHEEEFSTIRSCHPGTFNVAVVGAAGYAPPGDKEYRTKAKERGKSVERYIDGNHLSPRAKVIEINGKQVEAWIYRGGHPNSVLELISLDRLADTVCVKDGDTVSLAILEFPLDYAQGMPAPPPSQPGGTGSQG
jgi:hypothetical protein